MRECSRNRPITLVTRDVLAEAFHTGAQAAEPADDEVDLHAGAARFVELVADELRLRASSSSR